MTCVRCLVVLVMVTTALGLLPCGRKKKGNSCVQNITVDTTGVETGSKYHVKIILTNESRCLNGKTQWRVRVRECYEDQDLSIYYFDKPEGYLCPRAKCQRLKIRGVCSALVFTPEDEIDVRVAFRAFNSRSLHLKIKSDERVRSWNLTIFECLENLECYEKKVIANTGNRSVLFIEEDFMPDICYGFKLLPNALGACKLWAKGIIFVSPSGCYPQNSRIDNITKPVNRKHNHWGVTVGAVVAVVSLISFTLIIFVAWKRKTKVTRSTSKQRNSRVASEKPVKPIPTVLILHAQDSEAHVAMVTQLILRLKKDLCQVLDIFDDNNLEKLSNPSCWLQEIISMSSLKIVLVMSPQILDCFHALITTNSSTDTPYGWFNTSNNNRLLLAAINHLLNTDLVMNYNRVFVVSFGKTEAGSDFSLLVESRRYVLPQHQDVLLVDIMEECRNYAVNPCFRQSELQETTLCSLLDDDGHPHYSTTAARPHQAQNISEEEEKKKQDQEQQEEED